MLDYRLYLMTGDGHVGAAHELRAENDEVAILHAEQIRRGAAAELWSLKRRVEVFAPDVAIAGRSSASLDEPWDDAR